MNAHATIEVDGLGKRYLRGKKRELWALRDVSFSVPRGTLLGVVGPNGAGKTTLLKVLSRVTPPTTGRALMRGRVVSLLEVGAAFQPDLTARENVLLNAAMFGIRRDEVAGRMDEIAAFAELEDRLDDPVKRLSSGMYLRLAFSVAVNLEPDVLLADEVLAVGDAVFQERCMARVEEDGRRGLTVLFVSHDLEAVRRLCARTIWMNAGCIVEDGETEEVTERYESRAWAVVGPEQGGRESCSLGRLLSTRLMTPAGFDVGAVRTSEDFLLHIGFATSERDVEVRCAIVVRTGGVVAFRSAPRAITRIVAPGGYEAVVRVPGRLLADHPYSVKIGVELQRGGVIETVSRENAVTLRVLDDDPPHPIWPRGGEGIVRPALVWQPPQPLVRVSRRVGVSG